MLQYSGPRVLDALGDPTRRAMVAQLVRAPATVSQLAGPLGISLPGVLQHLHVLEEAGVVRTEKRGRARLCHLEPEALSAAERWLRQHRQTWEAHLDRLGQYLDSTAEEEEEEEE